MASRGAISMNEELKQRFMQEVLPYLSAEDDTSFWSTAFDTLLSDIEALYPEKSKKQEIFLQIGACSCPFGSRTCYGIKYADLNF